MKKVLFVFVAEVLLITCSDSTIYPNPVKQNFINGCAAKVKGNTALCSCLFEKIQGKYSFSEYTKIEEQIKAGQTPEHFLHFADSVTLECYKQTKN